MRGMLRNNFIRRYMRTNMSRLPYTSGCNVKCLPYKITKFVDDILNFQNLSESCTGHK